MMATTRTLTKLHISHVSRIPKTLSTPKLPPLASGERTHLGQAQVHRPGRAPPVSAPARAPKNALVEPKAVGQRIWQRSQRQPTPANAQSSSLNSTPKGGRAEKKTWPTFSTPATQHGTGQMAWCQIDDGAWCRVRSGTILWWWQRFSM